VLFDLQIKKHDTHSNIHEQMHSIWQTHKNKKKHLLENSSAMKIQKTNYFFIFINNANFNTI